MAPETCHLSLGSNLGDRAAHLRRAVEAIGALDGVEMLAASRIYETEPWGVEGEQPPYLNMAASVAARLPLPELLLELRGIERALGRPANTSNLPRIIDIDLLLYGGAVYESAAEGVRVPHAEMAGRAFVLAPLREIAAEARHPVANCTIAEMAAQVDMAPVRLWRGGGA